MQKDLTDDTVVAAMSPLTTDDTRAGLHTALEEVHGGIPVRAESTRHKQKTRYSILYMYMHYDYLNKMEYTFRSL